MKNKKQPSMVLDPGRAEMLLRLTDEEAGKIIKALIAYANTRALPEGFSGVLLFCFNELADELERGFTQQAVISERNRQRSMKRWASPEDAAGCRGIPRDATGCHGMPRDTAGCRGIPRDTAEREDAVSQDFNPMQFLMTGEEGEPIVVYKHG